MRYSEQLRYENRQAQPDQDTRCKGCGAADACSAVDRHTLSRRNPRSQQPNGFRKCIQSGGYGLIANWKGQELNSELLAELGLWFGEARRFRGLQQADKNIYAFTPPAENGVLEIVGRAGRGHDGKIAIVKFIDPEELRTQCAVGSSRPETATPVIGYCSGVA